VGTVTPGASWFTPPILRNPAVAPGHSVPAWAICFRCTPAMADTDAGPVGPASEKDSRVATTTVERMAEVVFAD
jgi:hypothetical protein